MLMTGIVLIVFLCFADAFGRESARCERRAVNTARLRDVSSLWDSARRGDGERKLVSTKESENGDPLDPIFKSQFKATKTRDEVYGSAQYWNGRPYDKLTVGETDRNEVMRDFDKARFVFLIDSIFVIAVGFSLVWGFGTLKDVKSYCLGSVLGLMYALLLGRFVENLGSEVGGGTGGGSARFAPVIILIAAYGKFRNELNLVPELLGFFTYQVSSFLQAFNEDLYANDRKE